METTDITRRTILKSGAIAAGTAGLTSVTVAGPSAAFSSGELLSSRNAKHAPKPTVIPWLDQPDAVPPPAQNVVGNLTRWEDLDSWFTPNTEFFTVKHYNQPSIAGADWRLHLSGLVAHPQTVGLATLKSWPRQSVDFTLECSGNNGPPFFVSGIGNARWTGTQLRRLLKRAAPHGSEVVFWGADSGQVTVRDDSGVTGGGKTGSVADDGAGGLDLTITEHFARSMSLDDAMAPDNLLCYQMNGAALPPEHGYPVRLIAPGWYGVANVKWLTRIEVTDGRFAGRFMARDYVTIREEKRGGQTLWTFTTVGHARLKSAPARVTVSKGRYQITGAAWGRPISKVEVQIDSGPWRRARLSRTGSTGQRGKGFAWRFWTFDWGTPKPGEHTVRCRAYDEHGVVQPSPDDAVVATRRTYWENNGWLTRTVRIPAT